jgi:DNA polymerase-3 subunit delta'
MTLLLQPDTQKFIANFIANPSHAVALIGQQGAGKPALAKYIVQELLNKQDLTNYPYFKHLAPENSSISIAAIRELQSFMGLKTTGSGNFRRFVIIEDADCMTVEAQNALLKLLEEPPEDTVMILTVSDINKLLPTIFSRCQKLAVRALSLEQAKNYFKNHAEKNIVKAFHISGGGAGLMQALLDVSEEHPLKADIESAKQMLSLNAYERLLLVESLSKDKTAIPSLLYGLKRVCRAVMEQAAHQNKVAETKAARRALKAVLQAEDNLAKGAAPKLLLDDLMLNL